MKSVVELNKPTHQNNTILQPVYMGKDKEDVEGQAEKINEIVQGAYDEFLSKTMQVESDSIKPHNLVKQHSVYVANLVDIGWGASNTLSFILNTTGMEAYDDRRKNAYPLFNIKKGTAIGELCFFGVDDYSSIEDLLNSYGYLAYTYNELADEQQISWIAYEDMPDKNWVVYAYFTYIRKET